MQVMTYEVLKMFIHVAAQNIGSEVRAWHLISFRSCGQTGRTCSVQWLF